MKDFYENFVCIYVAFKIGNQYLENTILGNELVGGYSFFQER